MFNFFGLRKDSKKGTTPERETDGFVMVGETADEQRAKQQSRSTPQFTTNVIVQPSKPSSSAVNKTPEAFQPSPAITTSEAEKTEGDPGHADPFRDIPFTLAPHILTVQASLSQLSQVPDFNLPQDINEHLANFSYDFTLEKSVQSALSPPTPDPRSAPQTSEFTRQE
ncbi:UBAP1-MVB12-associated (UMA)-domain containing protein 1 isoform X1 [Tachysurus vachellii]|nr:UBAP1-MVB12-associated (UMA)-domain containing protein 1 isoform X1 [Tachysurus vachellii]